MDAGRLGVQVKMMSTTGFDEFYRAHHPLAARWVAIAASALIVGGAVAAVAKYHGNDSTGSSPTPSTGTIATSTTALAPSGGDSWYHLISPDLFAENVRYESGALPGPAKSTVMAWGAVNGLQEGLLVLVAQPTLGGPDVLKFMSYGFSAARAAQLQREVVPGSGLPYVLPDPGVELLGFGLDGSGALTSQRYSNQTGSVTIAVGDYRGQLTPLALGVAWSPVSIAGRGGYRWSDASGVHVVWHMASGLWAQFDISPSLADRADGLILAVVGTAPLPKSAIGG